MNNAEELTKEEFEVLKTYVTELEKNGQNSKAVHLRKLINEIERLRADIDANFD